MKIEAVLFDADGVLILPEEVFSVVYAKSHGLSPAPFEQFFRESWPAIATGKKDLKESITENADLWQWHGTPDELLQYWFEAEDVRNEDLIALIRGLKEQGLPCYLASDQEKYRGEYLKQVMFKDLFNGYFLSCDLGTTKSDPTFFKRVVDQLRQDNPDINPASIVFFDDSQSKVDTARAAGINGLLYRGVEQVRQLLAARSPQA